MALDLTHKVSQEDIDKVSDNRHPPSMDPDFNTGDSGDSLDGIFSDLDFSDSGFGIDSGGGFGGDGGLSGGSSGIGGFEGFGNDPFSSNQNGFGNNPGGFGQNPINLGQSPFLGNQQTQQIEAKPDRFDKVIDASEEAAISFGKILIELFNSIKLRNADDFGYLSRNLILAGVGAIIGATAIGVIGTFQHVNYISFSGIPLQVIASGLLLIGTGLAGMGVSAINIAKSDRENQVSVQQLPDISETIPDDSTQDYEDNIGDIMDDLFGDSDDSDGDFDLSLDMEEEMEEEQPEKEEDRPFFAAPIKIDFNSALEDVQANQHLSRETLFNTFRPFFPCNTPTFADKRELDESDESFKVIETIAINALCALTKSEIEDIGTKLESCIETYFSYELRMKRIRGLNKTDDIAREMQAYFRSNSHDTSVNATVDIEGNFYKIVITKGESAVVTLGDLFRQQYVCDFILDDKNKLPMVTGISELGDVILDDAKIFDTMLIAGKPRSGKSWYVLSILLMLALFNTPEDVQFIIVDPKESNLFNTFSLLPHVAGLHNDKQILDIMDDIINNEGARRKKLLSDNRCDDIWALRKKGIRLPVLYLVIDEYITVRNNLGQLDKELDNKLQVIISQLPSQGIRLLFVPHRATGVVNKTNRTMLQFTAAVRADIEDVKDTLGVPKWNRALTKPGDIAIKTSANPEAQYVRGAAVTTDDDENAELIKNAAKAFYKMGVDIPNMDAMKIAVNRDEERIRLELQEDSTRIQYDNWDN